MKVCNATRRVARHEAMQQPRRCIEGAALAGEHISHKGEVRRDAVLCGLAQCANGAARCTHTAPSKRAKSTDGPSNDEGGTAPPLTPPPPPLTAGGRLPQQPQRVQDTAAGQQGLLGQGPQGERGCTFAAERQRARTHGAAGGGRTHTCTAHARMGPQGEGAACARGHAPQGERARTHAPRMGRHRPAAGASRYSGGDRRVSAHARTHGTAG